jgi:DNA replication protein DnaD
MDNYFDLLINHGNIAIPKLLIKCIDNSTKPEKFFLMGQLVYLIFYLDNLGKLEKDEATKKIADCQSIIQDLIDFGILRVDSAALFGFSINFDYISQQETFSSNILVRNTLNPEQDKPTNFDENHQAEKLRGTRKRIYRLMESSLGRPLSFQEIDSISEWVDCLKIDEDAIVAILEGHYAKGINNISFIEKVIHELSSNGKCDMIAIDHYFAKRFSENPHEKEIADYLSLQRNLTGPEKKLIKTWFEDQKRTLTEVLAACDRTVINRRPSLAHVDAILNEEKEPAQLAESKNAPQAFAVPSAKKKRIKKAFEEYDEFS